MIGETNSLITSGFLMVYMLVLIFSKNHIATLSSVFFLNKSNYVPYSEFPYSFKFATSILSLFSICVITAFIYLFKNHIHILQQPLFEFLAVIASIVLAYVMLKTLCIKIIGYVSENDELKSKMYAVETTILSSYGLFSGFFLTFCFFNQNYNINIWLLIVFFIFAILYVLKMLNIIILFIREKISPFFLILYLCALEILPIWLIIDFL